MNLSQVKDTLSSLLGSKGIPLYDSFQNKNIEIKKPTAFLYSPSLENEKRVLYPNGVKAYFLRNYSLRLEVMGKNLTSSVAEEVLKLIDLQGSFFDVKLSEISLSKVTSLPRFFVDFKFTDAILEAFTKTPKDKIFNGLAVYAFIESYSLENDFFTPHITLADGSEHYGSPIYRGRIYTLKLRFSSLTKEGFIYSSKTAFTNTSTFKIDDATLVAQRVLKAEVITSDNYETVALLSFYTE